MSPLEIVLHYHDRTKHHPQRYARSLGYLDWATQPDPFRRYEGAELIPLPPLAVDDTPVYDDLFVAGAIQPQPVTATTLSRFLECSLALSAWKQFKDNRWALRVNPSSGNLHPTEGYLVLDAVEGLSDRAGVFHYAPREHALERRCALSSTTWSPPSESISRPLFLVGLTSIYWREAWKYGERAFRYCQHDVGHALGALRVAAAMLGWRMTLIEKIEDADISRMLGLDREADFGDAEREQGDLLAAIYPANAAEVVACTSSPAIIQANANCPWSGRANKLSAGQVPWEVIDWVHEATLWATGGVEGSEDNSEQGREHGRSVVEHQAISESLSSAIRGPIELPVQRTPVVGLPSVQTAERFPHHPPTSHHIIRTRRSAVDFDGRTTISAEQFYKILGRVVLPVYQRQPNIEGSKSQARSAGAPPPFDVWSWTPRIHLFMFVHRVNNLPPGLYALIRDRARHERIRAATLSEFVWSRPEACPETLPLYFLMEADCRRAAKTLSLNQDIAGDGVFSLGMIADFHRSLAEFGPWFYKRLYWEAGFIGQLLYLEAEAAGIRATGIGAYFDDPVHEVFGFSGHDFQSLYHFTMGGAVEDPRLTTLPAYAWEKRGE